MEIKDLQKIMQDNGVVGAGGAGFPSYAKLTDKADIFRYPYDGRDSLCSGQ